MPSQRYDPADRQDAAGQAPDQSGSEPVQQQPVQQQPVQQQPVQQQPVQQQPVQQQPVQQQPSQQQPSQQQSVPWTPPADPGPGTQEQPSYGSYGTTSAYDASQGSSRSEGQPGRNYDPDGSYDPSPYDPDRSPDDVALRPADSDSVRAKEKDAFGGVKVGAAFFGWLTAVGATVILVALVAAVASALDLSTTVDGTTSSQDPSTLGVGKIIAGLGILFIAYYGGGYVAGRMARFNGARQGFAVWLWAVVIAAVLTLAGVLFGSNSDLARDVSLPDFRIDIDTVTAETLIAVGIVLAVTLIGAIVGGLAGMRFHRRVDRAGFAPDQY